MLLYNFFFVTFSSWFNKIFKLQYKNNKYIDPHTHTHTISFWCEWEKERWGKKNNSWIKRISFILDYNTKRYLYKKERSKGKIYMLSLWSMNFCTCFPTLFNIYVKSLPVARASTLLHSKDDINIIIWMVLKCVWDL